MASMETNPTAGVDLSLVMDEISLSQEFELWFGKSVFEGILAEVLQREHSGRIAFTLVDVLDLVVAVYGPDATEAYTKQIHPQRAHEAFYRSIHDRRCDTSEADWETFRRQLFSDVTTCCRRRRDERVVERHGVSLSTPSRTDMVTAPTSDVDNRTSSCYSSASSSSSSSTSSPVSLNQQNSAESLIETNGRLQSQPALQVLVDPAPAPKVAIAMHRYTSVLNEHAALEGERITYEKQQLSLSPSSWQCTAMFGDVFAVGTGRNTTQAKHEASKQICEIMDLTVL